LAGREPDGTVSQSQYLALQQQVVDILGHFFDTNALYTLGAAKWPVFNKVYTRPARLGEPEFGRRTSEFIGRIRVMSWPCSRPDTTSTAQKTPWSSD
jgi:hypothetical protein